MDISLMFLNIMGNEIFLVFLFIAFAIILFKVFKLVTEIAVVAIISAFFPLVMARLFGMSIALTPNTFLFFIVLGVGLLMAYKAFGLVKLPFKLLGSKVGLAVVLIIAVAAVWFFFINKPFSVEGMINRNCTTAFDCQIVTPECCNPCKLGMPVNKMSYEIIQSEKMKKCDFSQCEKLNCQATRIDGISEGPVMQCLNNTCTVELNCTKLCDYKINNSIESINSVANTLYLNASELLSQCSCQ
jgi:hypothetical protein